MAVVRRPAAPAKPRGGSVNIDDDSLYSGGGQFDLPPGKYALEASVILFKPEKRNEFLAVNMVFHPLDGGEPIVKPLSCGQKAALSFMPSEDGLGFEPIAGAASVNLPRISNWGIFRKSLKDSGLPQGYLQNDVSVLNGTWVVTDNQENEERKKLKAERNKTGEAASDPDRKDFDDKSVVVIEILEGGRPWEGSGGFDFPAAAPATAKTTAPTRAAAPAAAPARRVAPASMAAPEPEEQAGETEGLDFAVQNAMTDFLSLEDAKTKLPLYANGCTKLQMRTAVFNGVKSKMGDDAAQEAGATYFGPGTEAALNSLLSPLGYVLVGTSIKPA